MRSENELTVTEVLIG